MKFQVTSLGKLFWVGIFVLLATPNSTMAFSEGAANFSLVVTDSFGRPMAGKPVELLVELTTGSIDGQTQYAENHSINTDDNGLARFAIGFGRPSEPTQVFDQFDIGQGNNFLKVSVKEATGWRLLLRSQMPNVPAVRKWLFQNEKMNTVIATMVVVWLGIVVYLLISGRRLRRLETQLKELNRQRGE
jgi:CcmD family protein